MQKGFQLQGWQSGTKLKSGRDGAHLKPGSQEAGEGEGRSKSDRAPQGVRLCLDIKHEVY